MNAKHTVLLAEDAYALREGYTDYLKRDGFNVIPVESAEQLIKEAHRADILVVDARLPTERLEGIEAVGQLVEAGKLLPRIPVIFISVHPLSDYQCEHKLREYPSLKGRFQWLQKHFELELLAITIREQLRERSTS